MREKERGYADSPPILLLNFPSPLSNPPILSSQASISAFIFTNLSSGFLTFANALSSVSEMLSSNEGVSRSSDALADVGDEGAEVAGGRL